MEAKGKAVTFHSYKGGTGKSFLSLNVAAYLATLNRNVALLDYDFRAPTLFHRFQPKNTEVHWLNDYLDTKITFDNLLLDYSQLIKTNSLFHVGFASPRTRDMQEMQVKTRQWQQRALTLLMQAIVKMKQKFDWVILDSSPGVTYDSLNAMSSSDAVVLVSTPDHADILGTSEMCLEIWPSLMKFGAIPSLVLNKVPRKAIESDELFETAALEADFQENNAIPIIFKIPIFCDKSLLTKGIFLLEYPDHPLSNYVQLLGDNISKIFS